MWLYPILLFSLIMGRQCSDSATNFSEKRFWGVLDFAKKSINKAKDQLNFSDSPNISTCGTKERAIAFLEMAADLIMEAENNYPSSSGLELKPETIPTVKPIDCTDILQLGSNRSGVYEVWPRSRLLNGSSVKVFCDMETDGGGWTVVQRRGGFSRLQKFDQDWENYKKGFGDLEEEFWLGNDNIAVISNQAYYEVRFDLEDFEGQKKYAVYKNFRIENEGANYRLHVKNYSGTAGDGMDHVDGYAFSTKDRQNNINLEPCAETRGTGWWFNYCTEVNINGVPDEFADPSPKNLYWSEWKNYHYSLAKADMKLRRTNL